LALKKYDSLCASLGKRLSRHSDCNLPQINFPKEFSSGANLKGHAITGCLSVKLRSTLPNSGRYSRRRRSLTLSQRRSQRRNREGANEEANKEPREMPGKSSTATLTPTVPSLQAQSCNRTFASSP
jgi:hypothetical protein